MCREPQLLLELEKASTVKKEGNQNQTQEVTCLKSHKDLETDSLSSWVF